jgi:hypothetical protein
MKKKGMLLIAVFLLSAAVLAQAQEGDLSGTAQIEYRTSYIWRGFDYFPDDDPALLTNVDLDLYGTGFGINVLWAWPLSGNHVNRETIAPSIYYGNSVYDGEMYVTTYRIGWVYYGYPDEPRGGTARGQAADMQEFFVALSWPEICPAGWVPSYTLLAMWPSEGKSAASGNSGWAHILGLAYDMTIPGLMPETPEQILHFTAEAVYNDGVAPGVVVNQASGIVDHDWSHAVFGISTDFDLGYNLIFTPGFYYQSSWEDSVNPEDEYWLGLGLSYTF